MSHFGANALPRAVSGLPAGIDARPPAWPFSEGLEPVSYTHLDVYKRQVQAYHCTREPSPGFFEAHGLRLTNLSDHQAEFLESHGHHFTQAERETVEAEWDRQFHRKTGSSGVRNGLIWMCLSRPGVPHDGTDKFFTYFGGEAIYWPFVSGQHPTIAAKLQSIGQPVVVELAVPAKDRNCLQPLAHYVLSCHHHTLNPNIGIAAISGVLPNSHAKNAEIPPVAALTTTTQPLPASTQQVPGFELAVPNANPSIPVSYTHLDVYKRQAVSY